MATSITNTSISTDTINVDNGVLYVDNANNMIGVNKTNPAYNIDVVGRVRIDNSDTNASLYVTRNSPPAQVTTDADIVSAAAVYINGNEDSGSDALRIGAMQDGTGKYFIDVSNYNATASYDLLLQPLNGNVGIGTTGADAKLTVNPPAATHSSGYQEDIAHLYTDSAPVYAGRHYLNFFHDNNNRDSSGDHTVWGMAFGYDSNTRGGIQYDHKGVERMTLWSAYGDMHFKVANPAGASYKAHEITNSAMEIDNEGRILKPLNPAFDTYRNQSAWTPGNGIVMVFDSINTEGNVGGHYNTSNGRFTAPVSGRYHIDFYSIIRGNYSNAYFQVYVNSARITGGDVHFSKNSATASNWDSVDWHRSIYLNAGDYIDIRSYGSVTFHGNNWSNFSGYLVG